jgi:hypothetical protein
MYKNMTNLQYIIQFLTNATFACYGGEGVDLTVENFNFRVSNDISKSMYVRSSCITILNFYPNTVFQTSMLQQISKKGNRTNNNGT